MMGEQEAGIAPGAERRILARMNLLSGILNFWQQVVEEEVVVELVAIELVLGEFGVV